MKTYGQIAYEAYYQHCAGTSLISGAPLPQWADQRADIQAAWNVAAAVVAANAGDENIDPDMQS